MNRRILGLVATEGLLVAAAVVAASGQPGAWTRPAPWAMVAYAGVLGVLALLPRIYVEHERHAAWITPADAAIIVGLFVLGPLGFLVAATTTEVVLAWKLRLAPLKALFNLVSMTGGYAAATLVFSLVAGADPLRPGGWLLGVAALAACTLWDILSTSAVMALAEQQPFVRILREVAPPLLVSLALSAALGLVALVLYVQTPWATVLFVPVLGTLLFSTRAMSHHKTERIRFQRLYEATAGLAHLADPRSVLELTAGQARALVTGAAAVCGLRDPEGAWTGIVLDDLGVREADAVLLRALQARRPGEVHWEAAVADLGFDVSGLRGLPADAGVVFATAQVDPGGQMVVAVFRDLPPDEQREHRWKVLSAFVAHAATVVANATLHADVRRALEAQVELNRQKSDFVATVSHELRTPLAALTGGVQTIRRLGDRLPEDDRVQLLDLSLQQGERLRALIEDLLLVAASEHRALRPALENVDVVALVTDVVAEFQPKFGSRLSFSAPPTALVTVTDRDKVRRIVLNLLENARKYAPEGAVRVELAVAGDRLCCRVEDAGPGIAPVDRDRVFERFVQLDQSATRSQGGTGLGLHLARELAELLGGSLELADAVLGGACFELSLPVVDPGASTPGGAGSPRFGRSPLKPGRGAADPSGEATTPVAGVGRTR